MEHAILLSTLAESLNKKLVEIFVSNDFTLCALGILKRAVGILDWVSKGKSRLPTGSAAIDVLEYLLAIMRDICVQDKMGNSEKDNSADVLLSSGLVELMLDLLRELEPPDYIRNSINQSQSCEKREGSLKLYPYKRFQRGIIGVIGNFSYRRKHVRDKTW
ncbi:hypothetical protein NE237_005745 [Protea cynaroides]|uniref:Uncharacterized protein n=1 Tax=Protea cynaroides TaxID=273540 RepID=A0A9Q0KLT7_9MAGN|nr:hypothetical protein NE237_005745 [Protea cynaroides]